MGRSLRLTLVALAVGATFLAFGVVAAQAGRPHFTSVTTSITTSTSTASALTAAASSSVTQASLVVSFREAGLGANEGTVIQVTADASATYACLNAGGNHPKASNKETVGAPVRAEGTFSSDKNGSINGTLTTGPAPGPGDFTCPSGQMLVLWSVTFSNIVLTDTTNNVFVTAPDVTANYPF